MSLDVHTSRTREEAVRGHRNFSLDERTHTSLVRAVDRATVPLKLMPRIKHYYSDAEFGVSELDELSAELRMMEEQESNEDVLAVIRRLANVCQNASREGMNLYFFCD